MTKHAQWKRKTAKCSHNKNGEICFITRYNRWRIKTENKKENNGAHANNCARGCVWNWRHRVQTQWKRDGVTIARPPSARKPAIFRSLYGQKFSGKRKSSSAARKPQTAAIIPEWCRCFRSGSDRNGTLVLLNSSSFAIPSALWHVSLSLTTVVGRNNWQVLFWLLIIGVNGTLHYQISLFKRKINQLIMPSARQGETPDYIQEVE